MKVLLVAHQLPPRHVAGTEIYTLRLADALAPRHDVTIFAADDDPLREEGSVAERAHGRTRVVEVATARVAATPGDSWASPSAERRFEELLADVRPDVCHFQHLSFLSLRLPALARRRGAGVLMTLHDYWLLCARNGQLLDREGGQCDGPAPEKCAACLVGYRFGLSRAEARARTALAKLKRFVGVDLSGIGRSIGLLLRKSRPPKALSRGAEAGMLEVIEARRAAVLDATSAIDTFIAPSEFLKSVFVRFGFAPERFRVAGHGVDGPEGGAPIRPGRSGPLRIGFVGTLAPHKGVDLLIRAVSSMPQDAYVADVHGVDDVRPEYARAMARAAAGLPIRFHGPFEPGRAVLLMKEWDVAVAPSRWVENQPLVILEAFAAGVPVVAADLGGMRELVLDGVNGRLFPVGRSDRLAEILHGLAKDRDALAALRRGVKAPPSMATHASAVETLYHEASSS